VEDFQEHEYEFFSKLDEESGEGLSRRKLLKRGLVAGAGLTILSTPASALAMRKRVLATPPLRGKDVSMAELIAEA